MDAEALGALHLCKDKKKTSWLQNFSRLFSFFTLEIHDYRYLQKHVAALFFLFFPNSAVLIERKIVCFLQNQ